MNIAFFVASFFRAVRAGFLLPTGGKAGSSLAIFALFDSFVEFIFGGSIVDFDQGFALLCNLLLPQCSLLIIPEGAHFVVLLLDAFFSVGNEGVITEGAPPSAFSGGEEFDAGQALGLPCLFSVGSTAEDLLLFASGFAHPLFSVFK